MRLLAPSFWFSTAGPPIRCAVSQVRSSPDGRRSGSCTTRAVENAISLCTRYTGCVNRLCIRATSETRPELTPWLPPRLQKYGPVVRIAPWHVSFATPDAPSRVYAQGSAALDKSPFYKAFYVQGTESLFSTQNRALHASKRRLLSQPFSYQSIRGFEGFMRESLGRFVQRLDRVCVGERFGDAVRPGCVIDALLWFNYLAFDIISDLAFGEPLGMVNKASPVRSFYALSDTFPLCRAPISCLQSSRTARYSRNTLLL